MPHRRLMKYAPLGVLAVLSVLVLIAVVRRAYATGTITVADLSGDWQMSIVSVGGGCGVGTTLVNFTLDTNGSSTSASAVSHTAGCGDSSGPTTFAITSLNPNGSGTAGLTCGPGCGFTFSIQVAPSRSMFNLVDVTDPGNFHEGVAIHQ